MAPMSACEIVAWAHDRCGRGEEVHAVLKNDMVAGLMPSGRIGANGVRLEMAALALNLTALLRRAGRGMAVAAHEEPACRSAADLRTDLQPCRPHPGAGPHACDPPGPGAARRHPTAGRNAPLTHAPHAVPRCDPRGASATRQHRRQSPDGTPTGRFAATKTPDSARPGARHAITARCKEPIRVQYLPSCRHRRQTRR